MRQHAPELLEAEKGDGPAMMAQKTHESDIERIAVFGVCERERGALVSARSVGGRVGLPSFRGAAERRAQVRRLKMVHLV